MLASNGVTISSVSMIDCIHIPGDTRCLVLSFVNGADGGTWAIAARVQDGRLFSAPLDEFEATRDWVRLMTEPQGYVLGGEPNA